MLGNDHLGGIIQCFIIDLRTVEKQYHISILFDGSAFTQVGNDGLVICTLFRASVQLRQQQNGHIQLSGQKLHGTGHVRYFLLAVVTLAGRRARPGHELHIIDNDHIQSGLCFQPSAFGADGSYGSPAGIIDIQLTGLKLIRNGKNGFHLFIRESTFFDLLGFHSGFRTEHTHDQLLFAHFQTEIYHTSSTVDGGILADIHGKGAFAHGRSGSDNDQIGFLQTIGHPIQLPETCGHSGNLAVTSQQISNLCNGVRDDLAQGRQRILHLAHGNIIDPFFCLVERIFYILPFVHTVVDHLIACPDKASLHTALFYNAGIIPHIGSRGHKLHEFRQVYGSAHGFQLPMTLKVVHKGYSVYCIACKAYPRHAFKDTLVGAAVKIFGPQLFQHLFQGIALQEHGAQYRAFGIQTVGLNKVLSLFHVLSFPGGGGLCFFDHYLQIGLDVFKEGNSGYIFTDRADLIHSNLFLVDLHTVLLLQSGGYFLTGNGTKHFSVFTHLYGDGHGKFFDSFGILPGLIAGGKAAVLGGAFLNVHSVECRFICRGSQLSGQQKVSGIAIGYVDDFPFFSCSLYILFQYYLHVRYLLML